MPQFWVVAGPNGAGKTTFADRYLAPRIPVVSPDAIALRQGVGPLQAGRLAILEQEAHLLAGADFAIDTTFSGNRELSLIQRAAQAGYKVNLVFLCPGSPTTCKGRILERVEGGGHAVPAADVDRRYERSLANLTVALDLVDRAFVLDNAGVKQRLLLSLENGKVRHRSNVLPDWAETALPKAKYRSPGMSR
jgi:predicted ABC-type ATPase